MKYLLNPCIEQFTNVCELCERKGGKGDINKVENIPVHVVIKALRGELIFE